MKSGKKFIAGIAAAAACLSIATVTAFANTSSTPATGYGTLTGTLTSGTDTAYYTTQVTQNNDNAYLTIAGSIQDQAGKTLVTKQQINSSRGATTFSGSWTSLPAGAYAVYGTHGVQGGRTYGAYAVYTYTHV